MDNNNGSIVVYRSQGEKVLDEFIATHPETHLIGFVLIFAVCIVFFILSKKHK